MSQSQPPEQEKGEGLGEHDLLLAEYNALKGEMSQRRGETIQLISIALIAFGTILGIRDARLMFLYPVLAFFLSSFYVDNHFANQRISDYINHYMSEQTRRSLGSQYIFGWEAYIYPSWRGKLLEFVVGRAFFYVTELIAIITGILFSSFKFDNVAILLLGMAIIFTVGTIVLSTISSRDAVPHIV